MGIYREWKCMTTSIDAPKKHKKSRHLMLGLQKRFNNLKTCEKFY